MHRQTLFPAALATLLLAGWSLPAKAQESASPIKIAVIEVERILVQSTKGRAGLEQIEQLRKQKQQEGEALESEITELRQRLSDGGNALSEEKQAELRKQLEDKMIAARRFQDDANRDLTKLRDRTLAEIERGVMPVVQQVGQEGGYTIILNKFESGLVFADEAIDITDQVIERYNAKE